MSAAHHSAAVNTRPFTVSGYRGLHALFPSGAGILSGEQRNSAFGTREQATAAKTYGGRGGGVARR